MKPNQDERTAEQKKTHTQTLSVFPPMKPKYNYGPQFTASKFETEILIKIAQRAVAKAIEFRIDYDFQTAVMDLEACHCNGMELDLNKLLEADDATFGHDVFGIRRYIDRRTGKIGDCFVPRCALPENTVIEKHD